MKANNINYILKFLNTRIILSILIVGIILSLSACLPVIPGKSKTEPETETKSADAEQETIMETTEPTNKDEIIEKMFQAAFRIPEKKDITGKWTGYVFIEETNSDIIETDNPDNDFELDFYLTGDQLMVRTFGVEAPVTYTPVEHPPYALISFTVVAPVEDVPGVDAPPTASQSFEIPTTWMRERGDTFGTTTTLGSDRFTLHMGRKGTGKDGVYKWQWGMLTATGTWSAEKQE